MKILAIVGRVFEVLLGVIIFALATAIFKRHVDLNVAWIILFVILSAFAVIAIDVSLDSKPKKVIGVVVGYVLSYPIAYALQMLAAVIGIVAKTALWILKIKTILGLVIFLAVCIAIYAVVSICKKCLKD